jgi:hypothetical protein
MPGSSTTPGRSDLAMVRPKRVAFRRRMLASIRFLEVDEVRASSPCQLEAPAHGTALPGRRDINTAGSSFRQGQVLIYALRQIIGLRLEDFDAARQPWSIFA